MDTQDLKALAEKLAEKRAQVENSKHYLEGLKAEKDGIQQQLLKALNESGIKSIKTDQCFFSSVLKHEPVVVDEHAVIEALKSRGLLEDHMVIKLDAIRLKSTANALLKESGEVLDGMEIRDTEYISIRNNKKPSEEVKYGRTAMEVQEDEAQAKADSDLDSHIKDNLMTNG